MSTDDIPPFLGGQGKDVESITASARSPYLWPAAVCFTVATAALVAGFLGALAYLGG